ncbi:AEC family transporter [Arhodomonas sp. AD133]|uniref:AEC family transporter n=1 Tax=Arhodomonas sp. AD133 TaxID=3415009 RepID=UPI003EB7D2D5
MPKGGRTPIAIVNTLAPVFLIIVLGWGLTRTCFLSDRALSELNRVTYWIGVPSLLVERIAGATPAFAAVTGLLAVGVGATLLGIGAALVTASWLRLPSAAVGTFVQGVFRGNLAFIGLPVVVYAFAADGAAAGAEASALLLFGPLVVVYNVLAVAVLLAAGSGRRRGVARGVAYGLVTNPILIACALGVTLSAAQVHLPVLVSRTLSAIGQMALPLALLCIGGTLHTARLRGRLQWAWVGGLMKVALLPAIGWGLAWAVGLSAEHTRIALILLACPTATASYVLARQLGGDEGLASSLLLASSVLAIPAMAVVLWLTA